MLKIQGCKKWIFGSPVMSKNLPWVIAIFLFRRRISIYRVCLPGIPIIYTCFCQINYIHVSFLYLDEYMYIIYIYTSDIISMDSSRTQPPPKKKQWKKPSLKNLPPAFTTRHRPDGREGHHGDAPKIVGTPWSLRPREGGWVRRAEKCSSKGKVGETLGRVQKRYIPTYIYIYNRYMDII